MTEIRAAHNTGFASGGVTCKFVALCFYSSSVQVDSFVLRIPPERKARNRYGGEHSHRLFPIFLTYILLRRVEVSLLN